MSTLQSSDHDINRKQLQPCGFGDENVPSKGHEGHLSWDDYAHDVHLKAQPVNNPCLLMETTQVQQQLVTVPLTTFQQLVEFCAQVVRESKESDRQLPDLEYAAPSSSPGFAFSRSTTFVQEPPTPSRTSSPKQKPLHTSTHADVIWNAVDSWTMRNVPVQQKRSFKDDELAFLLETCRWNDDIYLLFRASIRRPDHFIDRPSQYSRYLISQYESTHHNVYGRVFNYSLMVVCVTSVTLPIGNILDICYARGVLNQPPRMDLASYRTHLLKIFQVSLIMNNIYHFELPSIYNFERIAFSSLRKILCGHKLEEVLGLTIPYLLSLSCETPDYVEELPAAQGESFPIDDLGIKTLTSIGGLSIEWTGVLEDHLKLNLQSMTLTLLWSLLPDGRSHMSSWTEMILKSIPLQFLHRDSNTKKLETEIINREIIKTWALILPICHNLHLCDRNMEREKMDKHLPKPAWLPSSTSITPTDNSSSSSPRLFRSFLNPFPYGLPPSSSPSSSCHCAVSEETEYSMRHLKNKSSICYSEFPLFETRIRELRCYMDGRKPSTLRQLWKDKRDTLSFYTFWVFVIFGGVSIFLGIASLVVGILQTVASFRALNGKN